jgi:hypothetical protein
MKFTENNKALHNYTPFYIPMKQHFHYYARMSSQSSKRALGTYAVFSLCQDYNFFILNSAPVSIVFEEIPQISFNRESSETEFFRIVSIVKWCHLTLIGCFADVSKNLPAYNLKENLSEQIESQGFGSSVQWKFKGPNEAH